MPSEPGPLILVVEDEPGVALLQRRRLERAGFRVAVAANLDAAMMTLGRGGTKLVVMDYRLGPTTGLDLHQRMKAGGFDVPVIMVSGVMDDTTVIAAMRSGIRDVVLKNADYLDYLPDAVRGVLRQAADVPEPRPRADSGVRILIVEDDPGVALLQRRRLERAGYHVRVAATAAQAREMVQEGPVSLAILDLRLADEASGLDLYEQLKAEGWTLPAILVTAYPDQAVAVRALRAGIRDLVPKSADYIEDLPQAVDRVIAQVQVERRLIESELRLASIIGTTMDAILMCDESLRVVLFNRSAEDMFGCPAQDAVGQRLDRFIPHLALGSAVPDQTGAPPGDVRQRVEVEGLRTDGESVPIEVSVSDVLVHDSRLFTVIARDVSERRRTEAELREADRRKDEFLGMLAHELRNPLAAIVSAGEVLNRTVHEPSALKMAGVVRRQAAALARMVDDLLDISRVTLGKIQLARKPLLLGELIARAAEAAADAVARAGLHLDVEAEPEPIWLNGDSTRLEQVLANLLNNAVKFTPAGGRVALSARRDGVDAVVRVRDTGIGMSDELVGKVFDLFVQGDTTLDRANSGLGIGLALVRQVVVLHGGQVTASSAGSGQWSEFVVRLPAMPDEAQLPDEHRTAERRAEDCLDVLVVDDHTDVADAVALLLEACGHRARVVYDGAAALAASRDQPPDVMMLDVGMPGMTGYELARRVRLDPALSAVRLVALTGYGREEDRARILEAGFDRHVTKPLTESSLQAVLASLHGSIRRAGASPAAG